MPEPVPEPEPPPFPPRDRVPRPEEISIDDYADRLYRLPAYVRAVTQHGRSRMPGRLLYAWEIVGLGTEEVYARSYGLYSSREHALQCGISEALGIEEVPPQAARDYQGYCGACGTELDHEGGYCTGDECEAWRAARAEGGADGRP